VQHSAIVILAICIGLDDGKLDAIIEDYLQY
jgi:hypothetical protein